MTVVYDNLGCLCLLLVTDAKQLARAETVAQEYKLNYELISCGKLRIKQLKKRFSTYPYLLILNAEGFEFCNTAQQTTGTVKADFLSGTFAHRLRTTSIKQELLAKAVGIKAGKRPCVLDATAGLGRDGFLLASFGCVVTMVERHPIIALLLADGLSRALTDSSLTPIVKNNIEFYKEEAIEHMADLELHNRPDVVYLDPMFPHQKSSAKVKKEMQLFRIAAEENADAPALLKQALQCATTRVVVKRPLQGPAISGPAPSFQIKGASTRYDIYLCKNESFNI
ncbi:16S rRNA (guanine(1516)-N(2))-methyltransferase [hydrothermal vent metagenome]|uniref:16S rRNA (Guanine(1516)-N(2))-methyltransferase n=1 Tax=hydrothermal vent metagenome TaxID=652676 RepID=A0A3B0Z962_9ZZZZ